MLDILAYPFKLSFLSSLPISVLRNLELEANKL